MALYTALEDEKSISEIVRQVSEDLGEPPPKVAVTTKGRWHGVFYGFWPTLFWTLLILVGLITMNIRWDLDGSLGFDLDPRTSVESSPLLPSARVLLVTRFVSFLLTFVPCAVSVQIYRQRRIDAGEPLFLGGLEVLLVFCTLWTWCLKTFYFFLATSLSALYVGLNWVPPVFVTAGLWVVFDMAFGMAWLVFWAVWVFLLPFAFVAGQKEVVKEMLSPLPFYLHNGNVVLMMLELIFSRWKMNLEHSIFPVYFALAYLYFNWWLYSKIRVWIYFFLDYDRPSSVPVCLILCAVTVASFFQGATLASYIT